MTELTYFTCTLGQAALVDDGRPFANVVHLLQRQAESYSSFPGVGFFCTPRQESEQWTYKVLSFEQIQQGSLLVATRLSHAFQLPPKSTVGLVCGSSADFLFTLLAYAQLGHPVLLIAPQCSASAVAHLCKSCKVHLLLHDENHTSLAEQSVIASQESRWELENWLLPWMGKEDIFDVISGDFTDDLSRPEVAESDIAYLHHSSGTSSGIPKPVAQSHRAAVGVLPALDGSVAASFTTTPLYHGGIADVFRAWTSRALIWLFPETKLPITATNVLQCLRIVRQSSNVDDMPLVKYFSSVPYVLQQFAESDQGLEWLKSMELVGVGGAALPGQIGDKLVHQGVKLVSRYGSVENGFLMSSHRDYDKDREWQYLRRDPWMEHLTLEQKDDLLHELVIESGWPHIAKINRENGSYATSDLFAPHPQIPDAWRYHSRADSQIALITGKKFDPAPIEDALKAASRLLSDVLVFGEGEAYPGALLFRSKQAQKMPDEDLLQMLNGPLQRLNQQNPKHARLSKHMLKPMPHSQTGLAKSSKGTILRDQAQKQYATAIKRAYEDTHTDRNGEIADDEMESEVLHLVKEILSLDGDTALTPDSEYFDLGLDSVASIQVRHRLTHLLPKGSTPLPLTIVQDAGTVARLTEMIIQKRKGVTIERYEDQKDLIPEFVKAHSRFHDSSESTNSQALNGHVQPEKDSLGLQVLLTGPTGFLGVHVFSQLLERSDIAHIYLLLRGQTKLAAQQRVIKALTFHKLSIPNDLDKKVTILTSKIADSKLGLSDPEYHQVAHSIDVILHLAWSVNFLLPLRSFHQHLEGVQNLVKLALASPRPEPPHFVFCSSIAAVSNFESAGVSDRAVPEAVASTRSCGSNGYAQSKLTAELICAEAASSTRMKGRTSIVRVGQLSGNRKHGIWNVSEAYPLILSTAKLTGCLPDLGEDETLTWLPVDAAATCFLEAALDQTSVHEVQDSNTDAVNVFHLGNFVTSLSFVDLLHVLNKKESFKIVSAEDWLARLEEITNDRHGESHPSLKLLPFWKDTYRNRERTKEVILSDLKNILNDPTMSKYDLTKSLAAMPSLRASLGNLDDAYLWTLWNWVQTNVT